MLIFENKDKKIVKSKEYNSVFDKGTGFFARWGETKEDDPQSAPYPEIADIEISSGKCHNACPFCYKQNTANGELHNMTLNEFKKVFHTIAHTVVEIITDSIDEVKLINEINPTIYEKCNTKKEMIDAIMSDSKLPIKSIKIYNMGLLTQIAFGITSPIDNPDFFKMMEYSREFDVIPNYTIKATDMTEDIADKTVKLCGACAVSFCSDKTVTYNAVNMLLDKGLKQTNIHQVAMETTFERIKETINDIADKNGIHGLNALVLLKYKPKGTNAGKFKPLTKEQYKEIFKLAHEKKVPIGFDSCSAPIYLDMIKDNPKADLLSSYAEPCESSLFSIYVNSYCEVYPCSFSENEIRKDNNWVDGINLLNINAKDFQKDVWQGERLTNFKNKLLSNNRNCPMFNLED